MDKQRLAEIMVEFERSKEGLENMDLSALLLVCEKGRMSVIGGANKVDLMAMICVLIESELELLGAGDDIMPFMATLMGMVVEGRKKELFRREEL